MRLAVGRPVWGREPLCPEGATRWAWVGTGPSGVFSWGQPRGVNMTETKTLTFLSRAAFFFLFFLFLSPLLVV